MKRNHKAIQAVVDDAVRAAIKAGEFNHDRLEVVVRKTLADLLTETHEKTIPYLLDVVSATVVRRVLDD